MLFPSLVRECKATDKIVQFQYETDPCPDYGGKVDGWTNQLLYVNGKRIGTSDDFKIGRSPTPVLEFLSLNLGEEFLYSLFGERLPIDICTHVLTYI